MAQWIHQNNIILSVVILFLASFTFITILKSWTRPRLIIWVVLLGISIAALFSLQTPSAFVTESTDLELDGVESIKTVNLEFNSVDEIEAYLSSSDVPTLVEFYSDFGLS